MKSNVRISYGEFLYHDSWFDIVTNLRGFATVSCRKTDLIPSIGLGTIFTSTFNLFRKGYEALSE